jgi:hypothetical protein
VLLAVLLPICLVNLAVVNLAPAAEIEAPHASSAHLHAMVDQLTTCLIGAINQIQRHNSSANHVTSKEQLEIWNHAITIGRVATNDGSDPGDE